jgi:hypothetical protein
MKVPEKGTLLKNAAYSMNDIAMMLLKNKLSTDDVFEHIFSTPISTITCTVFFTNCSVHDIVANEHIIEVSTVNNNILFEQLEFCNLTSLNAPKFLMPCYLWYKRNDSEKQKSFWNDLKTFINNLPKFHVVERQMILKFFDELYEQKDKPQTSVIDTYRRTLTKLGYLSDTDKPGKYKFIKLIPENLSSSEAKNLAYNRTE